MANAWHAAIFVALICTAAHSFEEVQKLEALSAQELQESEVGDVDPLMTLADKALREYGETLIQVSESAASPEVLDLTTKIKKLQSDIKSIRKKKGQLANQMKSSHKKALASDGSDKQQHIKNKITAGANDKDLDAELQTKNQELASLTIKQHDAAAKHAQKSGPASASASAAPEPAAPVDDGAVSGSSDVSSALFDEWKTKWNSMQQNLQALVTALQAKTQKLQGEVTDQHNGLNVHMETVKQAYMKEERGHKSALSKTKELQEKEKSTKEQLKKSAESKSKAVEKKQKQVVVFEKKVKALMGRKIPDCGPIAEKEKKAKAKIVELQAKNRKIKADAERSSKEMKQKLAAAHSTIQKLRQELAAAKAKINQLSAALESQKRETAKQIELKNTEEKAKKVHMEKYQKAQAKIQSLTQKLQAATAKYNKLKSTMRHINGVSNVPDKKA
jgi:chromosome segregation ATPase